MNMSPAPACTTSLALLRSGSEEHTALRDTRRICTSRASHERRLGERRGALRALARDVAVIVPGVLAQVSRMHDLSSRTKLQECGETPSSTRRTCPVSPRARRFGEHGCSCREATRTQRLRWQSALERAVDLGIPNPACLPIHGERHS